jgi:hypothetical protein
MKTTPFLLAALVAATVATAEARKINAPVDPQPERSKVQIALLLDTSSSMNGLIEQAKTQLWKVVNTFIEARRDGQAPFVEVALYEYGNDRLPAGEHYIRLIQPLSRDLDEISKQLFSLTTNGGQEYCGAVIQRSLKDLSWDDNPKTYKVVFIAGNEPFTQGPVDPRSVCRKALSKKIIINTIHCGPRAQGISGHWHEGAALGGGEFMVIDQNRAVAHIPAPQDARIQQLGEELNSTYIAYGRRAAEGQEKQQVADRDAAANAGAGSFVARSVAKASSNYHNAAWDLVDAVREENLDPTKIEAKDLPAELQGLKADELKERIETAAKKRTEIQNQIQELNKQREAHVAAERAKQATNGEKTLDEALIETTRTQAAKLGYDFGK